MFTLRASPRKSAALSAASRIFSPELLGERGVGAGGEVCRCISSRNETPILLKASEGRGNSFEFLCGLDTGEVPLEEFGERTSENEGGGGTNAFLAAATTGLRVGSFCGRDFSSWTGEKDFS